jgi:hypothetical protein
MPHESGRDPAMGGRLAAGLAHARDALSDRMLELGQKKASAADSTYNVIFTGKLTLADAQAVTNMANFFKIGADSARRLLQAGRVLKNYPNKAQADKLASLLTRAGAECRVEMEMPEEDEPSAVQKAAFALQSINIPAIKLPDYRQIGRQQWLTLGAVCALMVALTLWLALRPPTIHGDSAAGYQIGIDRILARADPQQAYAIQQAILLVTDSARKAQSESSTANPDMAAQLIYAPIVGKTAAEIVALAEARLEKQRAAFRVGIAEADQKIAALNQQLADIAPGNKVVLGKIDVVSAAFGWPPGAASPVLAFSIRNNSSENLMRVYLQGYLYDDNNVLLVSNAVTYSIASGIEPGASITATLPTQTDSPWALASLREKTGLVFKLRVANAENRQAKILGVDYRPLENDRQRHTDWKNKVQKQLDAVKL